ncbi:TPA: hypothetical protein ACGBG5_003404 [Enterococcus faecalis]
MFSFEEVILQLENKIALKTLKSWANKIERLTDKKFERKYGKNSKGSTYLFKVFSSNDVQSFFKLIDLRSKNVPLNIAIQDVFMSEEEKKKKETILMTKAEFRENQATVKELIDLVKVALSENAELKKRMKVLEMKQRMTDD